jgi:four helix bundle protein
MFDFEKLDVFQVAHQQNIKIINFLRANSSIDEVILERWKDASMNIVTSISESAGRINMNDKKDFLISARSSVFECVTFMMTCKELNELSVEAFDEFYAIYEQLSKMLLGMYRSYNKDNVNGPRYAGGSGMSSEVKPSNF